MMAVEMVMPATLQGVAGLERDWEGPGPRFVQITARYPSVHGAPIHIGKPGLIGIRDLAKPDWGDAVEVAEDELPVFWACGVTPQAVIAETRPEFCITHAPGAMLITDLKNSQLAV